MQRDRSPWQMTFLEDQLTTPHLYPVVLRKTVREFDVNDPNGFFLKAAVPREFLVGQDNQPLPRSLTLSPKPVFAEDRFIEVEVDLTRCIWFDLTDDDLVRHVVEEAAAGEARSSPPLFRRHALKVATNVPRGEDEQLKRLKRLAMYRALSAGAAGIDVWYAETRRSLVGPTSHMRRLVELYDASAITKLSTGFGSDEGMVIHGHCELVGQHIQDRASIPEDVLIQCANYHSSFKHFLIFSQAAFLFRLQRLNKALEVMHRFAVERLQPVWAEGSLAERMDAALVGIDLVRAVLLTLGQVARSLGMVDGRQFAMAAERFPMPGRSVAGRVRPRGMEGWSDARVELALVSAQLPADAPDALAVIESEMQPWYYVPVPESGPATMEPALLAAVHTNLSWMRKALITMLKSPQIPWPPGADAIERWKREAWQMP